MKENDVPAFPFLNMPSGPEGQLQWSDGMTLRDYFAAKAMAAILGKHPAIMVGRGFDELPGLPVVSEDIAKEFRDGIAEASYECADAMLLERLK